MRLIAAAALLWAAAFVSATAQSRTLFPGTLDQHPVIDYRTSALTDPVTALQRQLTAGAVSLEFDGGAQGFLKPVLAALNVPVESQILLFSKTGIQHPFTSPANPRALYFNDRVIVGYIPGAPMLETAAHDPTQGVIFRTLQQDPGLPPRDAQTASRRPRPGTAPRFVRPDRCLTCHLSANSLGVPGILVRSMFTEATGRTRPQLGSAIVDHRTPFEQRWGGWYVTGSHGTARHRGNAMVTALMERGDEAIAETTLNRATLPAGVEVGRYPLATSDIVALLVFDHQGHAMNLVTRLGWETRIALAEARADFTRGEFQELVNEAANYLLFVDEPALPSPVRGVSRFADVFTAGGVRDRKGRSLREFDLRTRLFRYRCSYMIYSPAFAALPAEARTALYRRMKEILKERGDNEVTEILDETVPDWSAFAR